MYSAKEAAEITGLSTATLRYYEKERLLPQIARNSLKYWQYTEEDIDWIRMIQCMRMANIPGCTKQACGFAERYPQFTEKGAVVIGISKDSVASHKSLNRIIPCLSQSCQTQSWPQSKPKMCGTRKIITAKYPWVWFVPPTWSMRKALSSRRMIRLKRLMILKRC